MAIGIRCNQELLGVASSQWFVASQIGILLLSMGCRAPWSGLAARPGEQGIAVKELTINPSDDANDSSRATAPRGQMVNRPSRYGEEMESKPKSEVTAAKSSDEANEVPAWVTDGLNAAPEQQRDLLRQQVLATLQARGAGNRANQPAASKRLSDSDDNLPQTRADATPEPRSAYNVSDRKATGSQPDDETKLTPNKDSTFAHLGAADSSKPPEIDKLTTASSSRKNASTLASHKNHSLPLPDETHATTKSHAIPAVSTNTPPRHAQVVTAEGASSTTEVEAGANEKAISSQLEWRGHVREALKQLNIESESSTLSPEQQLHQVAVMRMLNLSLGELESAMEPIDGMQPHVQDFFRYQFQALHDAIDPTGNPVLSRRWTLALQNARKALVHLSAVSNLEVQNLTFCSEVDSFGVTTKFPQYHFRPEQELLLYCELDNFVAEPVKDGFETQLQGSYEIVDTTGRRIADQLLQLDEHVCRNQRRDYFIAYRVFMPRDIAQGRYQLKLTIEDMKGRKFGQSTIDFQIVQ